MSRKSLLVFSIFLLAESAMGGTRPSSAQAGNPVLLADNSAVAVPYENVENFQLNQPPLAGTGADDDVCYKIRAYIFKRDDDHAPQLVGSTTCGPRKPHTKDAKWPDAKLVPAK
jgi:hypothetical protein